MHAMFNTRAHSSRSIRPTRWAVAPTVLLALANIPVGFRPDDADLPVQVEVLLQLVADGVEASLVRIYVERPSQMIRSVQRVGEA